MIALLEVLAAELRDQAVKLGYWVRPYDQLLDRRRWRCQPDGHAAQAPAVAAITAALRDGTLRLPELTPEQIERQQAIRDRRHP